MFSTTIEPPSRFINIGMMTLHNGIKELRNACRKVDCTRERPFALESNMYSEFSASNSSARI